MALKGNSKNWNRLWVRFPVEQDRSFMKEDPWLEVREDTNSTIKPEDMPRVEISTGMVVRYVPSNGSFIPLNEGDLIKMKTLIVVPVGSELVVSFIGKSAIRLEENTRLVIGPPVNNLQMIDLRHGTISAYLNPERDPLTSPVLVFARVPMWSKQKALSMP